MRRTHDEEDRNWRSAAVHSAYLIACIALATIAIIGCAPTLQQMPVTQEAIQAEAEKQRETAFVLWMKRQDRLMNVSYRLTRAGAEFCGKTTRPTYGLSLHDLESYSKDYKQIVVRHYGIGEAVTVRYVQPNFPAEQAGLQVGDTILAIDSRKLAGKKAKDALEILSERASSKDSLHLRVQHAGKTLNLAMLGVPTCDHPVLLTEDDIVNASADGDKVFIASGMLRFAESDDELALVVGHELSHDALGHISKRRGNAILGGIFDVLVTGATGVNTQGVFSSAAAQAFSQEFEAEADYEGVYIAARAGYDISHAPEFWRRMAAEHPGSIKKNYMASHPSTPYRFLAMEKTVEEIEGKKQRGEPLVPEKASAKQ